MVALQLLLANAAKTDLLQSGTSGTKVNQTTTPLTHRLESEVPVRECRAPKILNPVARFVSFAAKGMLPEVMGVGPIEVIPAALKRAGLQLSNIGLIELNEAFAA